MFIGEYRHTLDAKNRIIMPAKFREQLGDTFVATKGLDGCLTVYTQEQWAKVMNELELLPRTKKEVRSYIRSLTSKASECECDTQGRIQLPSFLVKEADIQKQCVVVGVGDFIEIWSQDRWDEYYDDSSESFEDIAENLTDLLKK